MDDLISRQAAIDALKEAFNPSITNFVKAKLAIENLPSVQPETHEERTKTHTCDYINRKDAIEAHYEYCNKHPDAGFPVWSLKILEDLPSAQPDLEEAYICGETEAEARFHAQQRWIPCSERLPDEEVLCCDTRGEMIIGYPYSDEESNTGFSAEYDDVFMIDCAAWMPLPEPYREEGD